MMSPVNPFVFIGTIMDITERKRGRGSLQTATSVPHWSKIHLTSSHVMIVTASEIYVNPAYLKTARISQQELLTSSPIQLSPLPAASAEILKI